MTSTSQEQTGAERVVRVGLIGCGKMGLQHLKAITATPGATRGRRRRSGGRSARRCSRCCRPTRAFCATRGELLEDVRPDVVHIVTPPATHAALARQRARGRLPRLRREAVHADPGRGRERLRARRRARPEGVRRPSVPVRGARRSPRSRRWRRIGRVVHIESYFSFKTVRRTITPGRSGQGHPAARGLSAGRAAARRRRAGPTRASRSPALDVRRDGDVYALVRLGDVTGVAHRHAQRPARRAVPAHRRHQRLAPRRLHHRLADAAGRTGDGPGRAVHAVPARAADADGRDARLRAADLRPADVVSRAADALLERFYDSIAARHSRRRSRRSRSSTPSTSASASASALDAASASGARRRACGCVEREAALPPLAPARPLVLVTGGTGLLGRRVAEELRYAGYPGPRRWRGGCRALASAGARRRVRRRPIWRAALDAAVVDGVGFVVHCAAETAGGKDDHQRNSIDATRHVFEAAARAGVAQVVHISSLAVLKPGREVGGPARRADAGRRRPPAPRARTCGARPNPRALVAASWRASWASPIKIIRPGPLVDYAAFQPPGRLGRELGPLFVAIGGKRTPLSVCDVGTAARVIRSYVEDFDSAPPIAQPGRSAAADAPRSRPAAARAAPRPEGAVVSGLAAAADVGPAEAGAAAGARLERADRRLRGIRQRALPSPTVAAAVIERAGPSSMTAGAAGPCPTRRLTPRRRVPARYSCATPNRGSTATASHDGWRRSPILSGWSSSRRKPIRGGCGSSVKRSASAGCACWTWRPSASITASRSHVRTRPG